MRPALAAPQLLASQRHQIAGQRLEIEPLGKCRDEHHPGIGDDSLIHETDAHTIQSDGSSSCTIRVTS